MAKAKEKKNYEFKTADGRFNFKVLKTADGKPYSIGGFYPIVCQTATGVRKLSKKEAIAWCIKQANEDGKL